MHRNSGLRLAAMALMTVTALVLTGCAQTDPFDVYRDQGLPLVLDMSPTAGVIGTAVTLSGELFGATQGEGSVKVFCGSDGGAVDAAIESWADTVIVFRIPSAHTLDARVVVELRNDKGLLCPFPLYLTVLSGTASE